MSIPYPSLAVASVELKRKDAMMAKTLCDAALLCGEEDSHNF
jgi:hypothetical protein